MTPEFHVTMEGLKIIAGWFGSVLNWRQAQTAEKRLQAKTALTSMMAAVRETRQYLAAVRANAANQSIGTERRLSELWSAAAIDMSAVDYELTARYLMKADYWSDPKGWTDQQKDDRLIQLDEMFRLGTEALLPH